MNAEPFGNGCTGWFDGVWRHCCDAHDLDYALGVDKLQADLALAACVTDTGHPIIALVMLAGVTLFGWFFYRRRKIKPPHS